MPNHSASEAVLDRRFHALADPTRRAVVARLTLGPASVGELAKPFAMALPSLLQHLRVLEESGLIRTEKAGRVRTCRIEAAALGETEGWLARQRAVWEGRLDRMEDYVETLKAKERNDGGVD